MPAEKSENLVIVDTCVWSLALRRTDRSVQGKVLELERVIRDGRAQMIGAIRQEILSGIKDKKQFEAIRQYLWAFVDEPITVEDYENAARTFNKLRTKGIHASSTDVLIFSISLHRNWQILSVDNDFKHYEKVLNLTNLVI